MKPLVKFIIAALVIIAGAMAFQAYKHGAFENSTMQHPATEGGTTTH